MASFHLVRPGLNSLLARILNSLVAVREINTPIWLMISVPFVRVAGLIVLPIQESWKLTMFVLNLMPAPTIILICYSFARAAIV